MPTSPLYPGSDVPHALRPRLVTDATPEPIRSLVTNMRWLGCRDLLGELSLQDTILLWNYCQALRVEREQHMERTKYRGGGE